MIYITYIGAYRTAQLRSCRPRCVFAGGCWVSQNFNIYSEVQLKIVQRQHISTEDVRVCLTQLSYCLSIQISKSLLYPPVSEINDSADAVTCSTYQVHQTKRHHITVTMALLCANLEKNDLTFTKRFRMKMSWPYICVIIGLFEFLLLSCLCWTIRWNVMSILVAARNSVLSFLLAFRLMEVKLPIKTQKEVILRYSFISFFHFLFMKTFVCGYLLESPRWVQVNRYLKGFW